LFYILASVGDSKLKNTLYLLLIVATFAPTGLWAQVTTNSVVAEPEVAWLTTKPFSAAERRAAQLSAARARFTLNQELTDYPSARFQFVRAVQLPNQRPYFCGEINAKNRVGGYTGFRPFVVDDQGVKYEPAERDYTDRVLFRTMRRIFNGLCTQGVGTIDSRDYSAELTFR
jgi:hypothetical protein